jgi:hypothetical protein
MTINSRNKGASFEREIAQMLEAELGLQFKRDLRQYQAADYGDLITDDQFPFLIECKRYAKGSGMKEAWWDQAGRAAFRTDQWPCVIYKYSATRSTEWKPCLNTTWFRSLMLARCVMK